MRQPSSGRCGASGSKLTGRSRRAASRCWALGTASSRSATRRVWMSMPRVTRPPASSAIRCSIDVHMCSCVSLLTRRRVVEQVDRAGGRPRPRLDLEHDQPVLARSARKRICPASRWPSSVTKPNSPRLAHDDAHGPVPRAGHAHDVLVADAHRAVVAVQLLEGGELRRRDAVGVARRSGRSAARASARCRGCASGSGGGRAPPRRLRAPGSPRAATPSGSGGGASVAQSPSSSRRCSGTVRHR